MKYLFTLILFFGISLQAQQNKSCAEAQLTFNKNFQKLEDQYSQISSEKIINQNKPTWKWGTNSEAVYMLHGFIGSPEEMSSIGKSLALKSYTVINDIIPGHGLNGFVANEYNYLDWQKHTNSNIYAIRKCFKKIHFIGFSTGALLIHDYLRKNSKNFKASSITFYSPFYKSNNQYAEFLRSSARIVTPVVPTQKLYYLTHFNDIKIATLKPDNYLQELPLDMAKSVTDLGQLVFDSIQSQGTPKIESSALVFLSNDDQIANYKSNETLLNQDFSNLKIQSFLDQSVPHHLMVNEVSSVAQDVIRETIKFIVNN